MASTPSLRTSPHGSWVGVPGGGGGGRDPHTTKALHGLNPEFKDESTWLMGGCAKGWGGVTRTRPRPAFPLSQP